LGRRVNIAAKKQLKKKNIFVRKKRSHVRGITTVFKNLKT